MMMQTLVELNDRVMEHVSVGQTTAASVVGAGLTYLLDPTVLASAAGLLTVILLTLKIVHQVRVMIGRAKDKE